MAFFIDFGPLLLKRAGVSPQVHDFTEQLRGFFRIVAGGMSVFIIPVDTRGANGPGQNGLSEGETAQRSGVKSAEIMKRIAFSAGSVHCRLEKRQIKSRIMTD